MDKLKLHLGCGSRIMDGWVNIDINTISERNVKLGRDEPTSEIDLKHDLLTPLPYESESGDFIYNEHFFEHFAYTDGAKMLKDWHRVLKPNGILRMAMPSIEGVLKVYSRPGRFKKLSSILNDKTRTKGIFLNKVFRSFGHRFLYDWETLEKIMMDSGFRDLKRCRVGKSRHPELKGIESRIYKKNSYVESLCVEARK